MKKHFILLLLAFSSMLTTAQQAVFADGSPAKELKSVNVIGSELFNANWQKAQVLLGNGASHDLDVKYNIYLDQLFFLSNGATMSFVAPVKQFTFIGTDLTKSTLFRNGYPKNEEFTDKAYYQVLADGKIQLLKKVRKQIMETKEFNSSIVKRQFVDVAKLYLLKDGQMELVKNDKTFLAFFSDREKQISDFVSSKKVNLKKEDGQIAVVEYYNSL